MVCKFLTIDFIHNKRMSFWKCSGGLNTKENKGKKLHKSDVLMYFMLEDVFFIALSAVSCVSVSVSSHQTE